MAATCGWVSFLFVFLFFLSASSTTVFSTRRHGGYPFNFQTETVNSVNGSMVELGCTININLNFSQFQNVTWMKVPRQLLTRGVFRVSGDVRFHLNPQNILNTRIFKLIIDPVLATDSGEFRCKLLLGNKIYSKKVNLVVNVPPTINRGPPRELKIEERQMLEVSCNATGIPRPNITWYTVFDTFQSTTRKPIRSALANFDANVFTEKNSLIITEMHRKMSGNYMCVANNGVKPQAVRNFAIRVRFAPEIEMSNSVIKQFVSGKTVIICRITAHPIGVVQWEFDGRPLNQVPVCGVLENREIKYCSVERRPIQFDPLLSPLIAKLTIFDITDEDFGAYSCKMSTIMGTGLGQTRLEKYTMESQAINYNDKFRDRNQEKTEDLDTPKDPLILPIEDNYRPPARVKSTPSPYSGKSVFRDSRKQDSHYGGGSGTCLMPQRSLLLASSLLAGFLPLFLLGRYSHKTTHPD